MFEQYFFSNMLVTSCDVQVNIIDPPNIFFGKHFAYEMTCLKFNHSKYFCIIFLKTMFSFFFKSVHVFTVEILCLE